MAEQLALFGLTDFEEFVRDDLIRSSATPSDMLVDFEIIQRRAPELKGKT